jgi:hypothetical protein
VPTAENRVHYPSLVKAGVLVAAALSLLIVFVVDQFERDFQPQNRDRFAVQVQPARFRGVLETVPASAAIGYITDLDPKSTNAKIIFRTAQYALAPRLLQLGPAQEWVIGNFSRSVDFQAIGAAEGLTFIQDYKNGVVLYHRGARAR